MDNKKLELLLERLINQTEKGSLNWKPTASEDTFLLVLKDSSISISVEYIDDLTAYAFVLQFRNEKGEIVENTHVFEDNPQYKNVEWLYELARRKGLNSESVIDSILKQLDPDSIAA